MDAPVEAVWALLQDVPRLAKLVPGVARFEALGPDSFAGELAVRVGPIQSNFAGEAMVVERVPPERIVAEIRGADPASGTTVRADFTGRLFEQGQGTRLEYAVDVALRGRLAQFGNAAIRMAAKKLTAEFTRALREELSK